MRLAVINARACWPEWAAVECPAAESRANQLGHDWKPTTNAFAIIFGDRFPAVDVR